MSDSEDDDIEAIRQRKREQLRQRQKAASVSGTPEEPIQIEDEAHFRKVLERHSTVLVDCYADWCGPCQMMEPTIDALAAETDAAVAKVDVDANQGLAGQLGAQGVPTFVVYSEGRPIERRVGAQDRATLETLVEEAS